MNTQPFTGFRPHSVLADFVFNKKTGILHCFPHHRKIYFEAGQLVFSESDLDTEHFSRILVRQGVLTAFQLEELERDLPPEASIGKALRKLGYADGQQLAKALMQQITDILTHVMVQVEGELATEFVALPEGLPRLKIQTLPLLVQILTATGTVETVSFSPEEPALEPAHDFLDHLPEDLPKPFDRFRRFANGKPQFSFRDLSEAMELDRHEVHAFLYLLDLMNFIKIHPSKRAGLDLQTLLQESQEAPKSKDPVVLGAEVHEQAAPPATEAPPASSDHASHSSFEKLAPPDDSPMPMGADFDTDLERAEASNPEAVDPQEVRQREPQPQQDSLDDVSYESLAAVTAHEAFDADASDGHREASAHQGLNPTPHQAKEAERAAAAFLADFNASTDSSSSLPADSVDSEADMTDLGQFNMPADRADTQTAQTTKLRRGVILPDRPDPFDDDQLNQAASGNHRFLLWVALLTCVVLGGMFAMWKLELFNDSQAEPQRQSATGNPVNKQTTSTPAENDDTIQLGDGQPLTAETAPAIEDEPASESPAVGQPPRSTSESTRQATDEPEPTTSQVSGTPGQSTQPAGASGFDLHALYRSKNRRLSNATLDAMITDSQIALLENNASHTIAFLVACNPDTLREFLDRDELTPLYLLPRRLNGQRCYLLSWNHFDSQAAAQSAINKLPASLRVQGPWVLEIP